MRIWTIAFTPFRIGAPGGHEISTDASVLATRVEFHHPRKRSVILVQVESHERKKFWVEQTTGALMGQNLSTLFQDYVMADPEILLDQFKHSKLSCARAELLSPEKFWGMIRSE